MLIYLEELIFKDKIANIAIKFTKLYRSRGPEYVKVNIDNDTINICIKGILSNVGKLLLEQKCFEDIVSIWGKINGPLAKQFLDEVHTETGKKCMIFSEVSDYKNDMRILVLKIEDQG